MSSTKKPDKDMDLPKTYKSSIDSRKTQPSMSMDTRHKEFKPTKTIDFNNKIAEYKPNNQYYKTSFWDAPRKKLNPPPKREEPPKAQPPPPRPFVKREPKPPPPRPQQTLKPLPQANMGTKRAPAPKRAPIMAAAVPPPRAQTPPTKSPTPSPYQEPEPERALSPVRIEHWSEPTHTVPVLAPAPAPVKREQDFTMLPSTVGSMSRMFAMFN